MHTAVLKVVSFGGASELPLFVADEKGFLADEGLRLEFVHVHSSQEQLTALLNGSAQIMHTFADNVIAFTEEGDDMFIFMGISQTMMSLIVQPFVSNFGDLKGQSLAVDAVGRGFTLVLVRMLEMEGLDSSDYTLLPIGSSRLRLDELIKGAVVGTPLIPPYDTIALLEGFKCLARPAEYLPAYQGLVGAASRRWAQENNDILIRYIRAYVKAGVWLRNNSNHEESIKIIASRLGIETEVSTQVITTILNQKIGLCDRGRLSESGIETVINLRASTRKQDYVVAEPSAFCDLAYYKEATSIL